MRKIKLDKDVEITEDLIIDLINKHENERSRILKMKRYYNNQADIFNRVYPNDGKPHNTLSHNYAAYITNNFVGYMVGQPITYKTTDKEQGTKLLEQINQCFLYNDEVDNNTTLAQEQSICGYAYELLYTDDWSDLRFKCLDTENTIVVYDNTLEELELFAILYNKIDNDKTRVYVYDKQTIRSYIKEADKLKAIDEAKEHYFNQVPIATYENNRQRIGDFEKVISLIDAYNQANSDTANDFEYFTNALLVISGMILDVEEGEEENTLDFKNNRVLNFSDPNSKAEYLIKNINDTALENYKNRLNRDIHKFANVVDMSDEKFAGNLSGIAIKYKTLNMENATAVKEAKFRKGLMKRIELIVAHLKVSEGSKFRYLDIVPVFTRNLPINIVESAQMVKSLNGIVSEETLLSQLPFIEDIQAEKEAKKRELEEEYDDYEIEKHEHSKDFLENEE